MFFHTHGFLCIAILGQDSTNTAQIDLNAAVTANSALPVIQVLGVEFYQEVNGAMYLLQCTGCCKS